MTKEGLAQIKEAYDMLQKGLNNPQKINVAYKHLNPIQGMEVPIRVKIVAINRFMMLSYADALKELNKVVKPPIVEESVGIIENEKHYSHHENVNQDVDILEFLTADEKQDLKSDTAGTTLEIVKDGKKKRTRKKA